MDFEAKDILVVDDYRPLAEAAATVAHMVTGCEAQLCMPAEAMRLVREGAFALIILNRDMKPIAGAALCQKLRADPVTRDVPILMMGSQIDPVRARALGADDGIATPFNSAAFREVLARLTPDAAQIVAAE